MIRIENTEVTGLKAATRGMRNPMNSWAQSDSKFETSRISVGEKDFDLMKRLVSAGTDHSKFMRMITVSADVTAPLYWWKEYDTYKVGTVANSCSTMHKLTDKEFEVGDFSWENLLVMVPLAEVIVGGNKHYTTAFGELQNIIRVLNHFRKLYLETDDPKLKKTYWWQMIQLLPSSYNQKRTIMLNYAVLRNIYHARRNHKLDEWHRFCEWIEELPYSELITMGEG